MKVLSFDKRYSFLMKRTIEYDKNYKIRFSRKLITETREALLNGKDQYR